MNSFPTTYGSGTTLTLPSQGTGDNNRARVNRVQFGDGYEARSADGINTITRSWPITWKAILIAERDAIVSFLEARGGVEAFSWTPPNTNTTVAVTCDEWNWTNGEYNTGDLRATFKRAFEV